MPDPSDLNVVSIKNDLPARVTFDALPGETINGVVTDIASVAMTNLGEVTYEVTVALEESDLPLRWGMTAVVDIETEF